MLLFYYMSNMLQPDFLPKFNKIAFPPIFWGPPPPPPPKKPPIIKECLKFNKDYVDCLARYREDPHGQFTMCMDMQTKYEECLKKHNIKFDKN